MRKGQQGVSLTELAVVVAVIGLLLASIVGGVNLLSAAKVKKLLVEIENTKTSIDEFYTKYGYLPGDFHNAISIIGAAHNGDGDTVVEGSTDTAGTPQEDLVAWEHLALAELIRGSYTGEDATTARYEIGTNAYTSEAFSTAAYSFKRADTSYYNTYGTVLKLGTVIDNTAGKRGLPYGGVVTARDAYAVDSKVDDGKASKGHFYTVRRHPEIGEVLGDISTCVTDTYSAASADYQLDDNTKECHLVYWYKKD